MQLAFVEDIANFGIATFADHASDLTELIACADRALFAVEEKGKVV